MTVRKALKSKVRLQSYEGNILLHATQEAGLLKENNTVYKMTFKQLMSLLRNIQDVTDAFIRHLFATLKCYIHEIAAVMEALHIKDKGNNNTHIVQDAHRGHSLIHRTLK